MDYLEKLDRSKLPKHIAIIMDGNGRWAEEKGKERLFGHFHGVESVRDITEGAAEIGIEYLTLYAFSTENWDRPADEVTGLMEILVDTIKKEVSQLNKNNIRLVVIGDMEMMPKNARTELMDAVEKTGGNTGMRLVMALSYSSRWEIVRAAKNLAQDVADGSLSAQDIDAKTFEAYLSTRGIPDPELMIRTSGEFRISNFLMYQLSYAELYFTNVLWPDFRKNDLCQAIYEYQQRERRFGKTGAQIKAN